MPTMYGKEISPEELQIIYDKRPFHAYDVKSGARIGFNSMIDLHQALSNGHVQMHKPGEKPEPTLNPLRNYDALSSEDITRLCARRNVPKYMTLTRDEMVKAILALDAADDERLRMATEVSKADTPKKGK